MMSFELHDLAQARKVENEKAESRQANIGFHTSYSAATAVVGVMVYVAYFSLQLLPELFWFALGLGLVCKVRNMYYFYKDCNQISVEYTMQLRFLAQPAVKPTNKFRVIEGGKKQQPSPTNK